MGLASEPPGAAEGAPARSAELQPGTDLDSSDLGRRTARGAVVTLLGQGGKAVVQLVGLVLLARLLSPRDFGLIAMIMAIVGIADVIRDFGLSVAALQARTLSARQRDNLFWLNSAIGFILGIGVYLCAVPISALYTEPSLVPMTQVLAATFFINGLATQYRAGLNRALRFTAVMAADLIGLACGLSAAVVLALTGHGFWSLVAQQMIIAVVGLGILVGNGRWVPGLPHRTGDMTALVRFGIHQMLSQMINYFSRNIDSIIVGIKFGPVPLGLYSRGYQLYVLPINQISNPASTVAIPVLARIRDDARRFSDYLLRGQLAVVHLVGAASAVMAALAAPIVEIALGEKWLSAATILTILAAGGVFQGASSATYWVLTSTGNSASLLRFTATTRVLTIPIILIGSFWGVLGVAAGYSVGVFITWIIGLFWIRSGIGTTTWQLLRNAGRAIIGYGLSAVVAYLVDTVAAGHGAWFRLTVGLAAFLATLCLASAIWPSFRRDVALVMGLRHMVFKPRLAVR